MNAPRPPAILSVNAGSSSLKFALYPVLGAASGAQPRGVMPPASSLVGPATVTGLAEGLEPGGRAVLRWRSDARPEQSRVLGEPGGEGSYAAALAALREVLAAEGPGVALAAIAHRIVHGGAGHAASVWLDDERLAELETLSPLAPLHQPHNLAGVRALREAYPDLPQLGCFDTAFHATLPDAERLFALPRALAAQGIRRYGFHGLSYRYLVGELQRLSARAGGRLLMAHLGNGASLCAARAGRSVATTMGFSTVEGLMMGTRSGSIDPGVLIYLMRQGWTADRLDRLLNKESGLLGVSGLSADMRTLRASIDPRAAEAVALFTHHVVRECGALAACLNGVDVLAFTGGIGEHDAKLRADVVAALAHLGLRLDPAANEAVRGDRALSIHAPDSAAEVWVVPTDEGRVAAADAAWLLAGD